MTEALHNQDNISHTMESERYAPFPLTPIQHAYWIGRKTSLTTEALLAMQF